LKQKKSVEPKFAAPQTPTKG